MLNCGNYLSGFADGEGSFCISFSPSKRHKFGWEIRPSFSVSQNSDRAEVLILFKTYWNRGSIRPDRSDKTLKFEIRAIDDLVKKVIPHFEKYPLVSSKHNDFEHFSEVCKLIVQRKHLESGGFKRIVELAFQMNPSGKRKYSKENLFQHFR